MTPWWGSPTPNHYHVKKMALKKLAKSCATRCTVDLNCLKLCNLLITKLVVCFKLMGENAWKWIVQDKILMPTKYLYFHQTLFWTFKTYCDKHYCCQCHRRRQGIWLKNLTLPGITYTQCFQWAILEFIWRGFLAQSRLCMHKILTLLSNYYLVRTVTYKEIFSNHNNKKIFPS